MGWKHAPPVKAPLELEHVAQTPPVYVVSGWGRGKRSKLNKPVFSPSLEVEEREPYCAEVHNWQH